MFRSLWSRRNDAAQRADGVGQRADLGLEQLVVGLALALGRLHEEPSAGRRAFRGGVLDPLARREPATELVWSGKGLSLLLRPGKTRVIGSIPITVRNLHQNVYGFAYALSIAANGILAVASTVAWYKCGADQLRCVNSSIEMKLKMRC